MHEKNRQVIRFKFILANSPIVQAAVSCVIFPRSPTNLWHIRLKLVPLSLLSFLLFS